MLEQAIPFDISKAGTTLHLCLQNVRKGYGIRAENATAKIDWDKNFKQHKDRAFPAGCTVPIYFNLTIVLNNIKDNYGHIAVALPDGRFWSDGRYFSSIEAMMNTYLKNGKPSYLGWGESVNSVRVVKEKEKQEMASRDIVGLMIKHLLYREPTKADYDLFTPLSVEEAFRAIGSTDERNAVIVQRQKAINELNNFGKLLPPGKYIVK